MIKNIQNYFQGVFSETKKITWPSRKTVINHTLSVVGVIIVATIVFGAIDIGLTKILERFIIGR